MKKIGQKHSKMLGIAIGDKAMLVAEVTASGSRYHVTHVGQFTYGEGQGLLQPEALGQGLAKFLKVNGFSGRRAVFGVPAKWVLTKSKEVPAADEQTIASSLRLQAEGEFSPELKDLVYDYAGQSSSREGRTVLLLATPRRTIDQINAISEASKIEVEGITVSVAALSAATSRVKKDSLVLSLGPSGAELGSQPAFGPSVMRHVGPASAAAAPMLLGELRRATATSGPSINAFSAGNGSTNGNGHARRELVLWDDADTSGSPASLAIAACRTMGEAAGLSVVEGDLAALGVTGSPENVGKGAATAVALAIEGIQGRLPIDFANTRLAPPKEQRFDRRVVWSVIAGAAVLLLAVSAWVDISHLQSDVDFTKKQVADQTKNKAAYEADVTRIQTLLTWHTGTPKFVPCVTDITLAFPQERDLYLVSFALRQDQKNELNGTIQGRVSGSNTGPVYTLLDRMAASNRFANVTPEGREGGENKEAQFSVNFAYAPQPQAGGGTAPARATASRSANR